MRKQLHLSQLQECIKVRKLLRTLLTTEVSAGSVSEAH